MKVKGNKGLLLLGILAIVAVLALVQSKSDGAMSLDLITDRFSSGETLEIPAAAQEYTRAIQNVGQHAEYPACTDNNLGPNNEIGCYCSAMCGYTWVDKGSCKPCTR